MVHGASGCYAKKAGHCWAMRLATFLFFVVLVVSFFKFFLIVVFILKFL